MTNRPGIVRRGRPPLPEEARCKTASFKLDRASRSALDALARHWGIGLSATVRRALQEAASAELPNHRHDDPPQA